MKRNIVSVVALGLTMSVLLCTGMAEASDVESHEANAAKDFDYEVFTSLDEASAYGEIYGHETYHSSNLEEIGETDVEMFLCINGRIVALFPQFKDPQTAMENAKVVCEDVLEVVADYYGLDELSEENWESYEDFMYQYLYEEDIPDWYTETDECFAKLSVFFEIYRDKYRNEETLELVENTNTLYELLYETDFEGDLPYFVWDSYVDALATDAEISKES